MTLRTLALSTALLLSATSSAALNDSGPMGLNASGVPTPDASVLAKQRLPDLNAPLPLSSSSSADALATMELRKTRFHKLWLRMQAMSARYQKRSDQTASKQLAELQNRYQLSKEADGAKLTGKERRHLREALDEMETKLK